MSGDGPRFLTDSDTKTVTVAGGNHDNYHIGYHCDDDDNYDDYENYDDDENYDDNDNYDDDDNEDDGDDDDFQSGAVVSLSDDSAQDG